MLGVTINEQENRIRALELQNETVLKALNNSDREARSTSLVFYGDLFKLPNNSVPSALTSIVQGVCKRELNCVIPPDTISACRLMENQTGKKSVLLTFSRISIKEQLLTKAIQTKKKGLFINEYLTQHNSKLLYELRKIKREFDVSMSTFSRNGIPCFRLPGGQVQRILNADDLITLKRNLTQGHIRTTASTNPGPPRRSERINNMNKSQINLTA